ncbi:hypothetical protein O6H91_02G126500 [Diphasiastrum complanatum]|uniref:Uncharacterized protein n=1 Tax=Diphasiastrum complanatum TaxID=34168 RepID=A0ACC2EKL4_DIPCM|nr:hypothetical protein O6H91_02G126500 [Diphasiastrum complanatum]
MKFDDLKELGTEAAVKGCKSCCTSQNSCVQLNLGHFPFESWEFVTYFNGQIHPKSTSITNLNAAGKYKQEGKNYVVQDGDIILFKFNVTSGKK